MTELGGQANRDDSSLELTTGGRAASSSNIAEPDIADRP